MEDDRLARLKPRMRDCLRGVADLKQTDEIAATLGLASSTVNTYLDQARRILGASTRKQAARLFLELEKLHPLPSESIRSDFQPIAPANPDTHHPVYPKRPELEDEHRSWVREDRAPPELSGEYLGGILPTKTAEGAETEVRHALIDVHRAFDWRALTSDKLGISSRVALIIALALVCPLLLGIVANFAWAALMLIKAIQRVS